MADITEKTEQGSPNEFDEAQAVGNGSTAAESRGVKRQRPSAADDDDDDDEKGGRERRKIEIKFISDKSRRHITFSKRKAGIMKKVRVASPRYPALPCKRICPALFFTCCLICFALFCVRCRCLAMRDLTLEAIPLARRAMAPPPDFVARPVLLLAAYPFLASHAKLLHQAYELSVLTGTQVLLLVVSETGLVYTFTTPKLQPLVTKAEGKNLIQVRQHVETRLASVLRAVRDESR